MHLRSAAWQRNDPAAHYVLRPLRMEGRYPSALFSAFLWLPVVVSLAFSTMTMGLVFSLRALPEGQAHNRPLRSDSSDVPPKIEAPAAGPELAYVFTPQVLYWAPEIELWSVQFGLDPNLVATVIQIESCGHPDISSRSGALGLFQVMPYHFTPGENPFDPQVNARRGLAYLSTALKISKGHINLALAGYNGGHAVIDLPPSQWSPETRRYVRWGMGILNDIESGNHDSPTLDNWLRAGGQRLCEKASLALGLNP